MIAKLQRNRCVR